MQYRSEIGARSR